MSIMHDIKFHIGIDCPFCLQQTTNTLSGTKNLFYNHIYCSYCKLESLEDSFISKFEMWFVNDKLIAVSICDNLLNIYYYSEFLPASNEIHLFKDNDSSVKSVSLKKWDLRNHINSLYNYIERLDLDTLASEPGFVFKIKQILDNFYISDDVKSKLFKINI